MTLWPNKDDCTFCKNILPNKDGWRCCCKAFPDGIPHDILFNRVDKLELKECANGYKYDPDPEKLSVHNRVFKYTD